jgi:hypothetical protein
MAVDPARFAVGVMARHLAAGYYAFLVAHFVAVNPKSINSLPPATALGRNPTGEIKRKDGTFHTFDLRHYLDLLREDQSIQERFLRTWAAGALLMLGDKLSKHSYFDHAPILEMVYHLRNGIAHGNQFNIDDRGRRRLRKHAAHNRDTIWRSPVGVVYEITPNLTGPILFDFIGAADVIDLLQAVEVYLTW